MSSAEARSFSDPTRDTTMVTNSAKDPTRDTTFIRTPQHDALFTPEPSLQQRAIKHDLAHHARLQKAFDIALARSHDSKDLLERAYNPVTDRMHVEKQRAAGDKEGEKAYIREIRKNLETKLKERLQVAVNIVNYDRYGIELVSEHFPNEPFSHVLERGAEYRLAHGTTEPEREGMQGERGGWEKIRKKFTDPETPVGTKMTSFSVKGIVDGSPYNRNVLDEYEMVEDERGKHLKLTRYLVDFNEADYSSAALSLAPDFFDGYDGRPLDAWYLAHPVEGALSDIKQRLQGMPAEDFSHIFASPVLQGLINYYVERITDPDVNWEYVARSFNAILNQVDKEEDSFKGGRRREQFSDLESEVNRVVNTLGWIKPEEKGGAGCPTSKGYGLSNSTWGLSYTGSVASFGGAGDSDSRGPLRFQCTCGVWHTREKDGPLKPQCNSCGSKLCN